MNLTPLNSKEPLQEEGEDPHSLYPLHYIQRVPTCEKPSTTKSSGIWGWLSSLLKRKKTTS